MSVNAGRGEVGKKVVSWTRGLLYFLAFVGWLLLLGTPQ